MNKPAYILLVEDNRMDIELTLNAFREVHLENKINVVRSGQEALDYIHGQGQYSDRFNYPMPDIILLDLKLPGVDGFTVLKKFKATPLIKRIPVIILTSSQEEADRAQGYDNGANSYLVKPVSFDGFLQVVNEIGEYWISLNVGPPMTS